MSATDPIRVRDWDGTRKDAVRAFNKRVLNPAVLSMAGRRYAYAAVIRHVGRRSGNSYTTPVIADPVRDGFVIPLPNGTRVDWLRNVLAAGRATVQVRGETYAVTAPKVIDADAALAQLPSTDGRVWRRLGVQHYLKVIIRAGQS